MAKKTTEQSSGNTAQLDGTPTKRFYVHLAASTPIAHNGIEIEADTPEEAWSTFCAMNAISGSSCDREITEVKE